MLHTATARALSGSLLSLSACLALAQSRATCSFSETFTGTGLPVDWIGLPTEVERLNADGSGSGQFTAPWQVGTAAQANAAGYFPVPDEPAGNTFVMANDDAAPCDCRMDDLSLFSPFYDLSATPAPALSYRVYHDGRPFNGHAWLEVSNDGADWVVMDQIPAVLGSWQQRTVDLGAFSSGWTQLRFRYDDNGDWSSGLAVDDICIFSRVTDDIALTGAWLGDRTASPFSTNVRSLGYSRMPLEQQSPLRLSAKLRNNGLVVATAIRLEATVTSDAGTQVFSGIVCETLEPLQDTLVTWEPGFLASEAGSVSIALTASALNTDVEPTDNTAQLAYVVTSVDEGNNAMAVDNDLATSVCGTDDGFSAGCRFELAGGASTVYGISVRLGTGTLVGSRIHTLLMDGALNLLSSSASHTVSEEDLALSFSGGSVYIPLDSAVAVTNGQDVIALVRCLPDSGALRVASGGPVQQGSAFIITASDFLIAYPGTAPIVRIHLSAQVVAGTSDGGDPDQRSIRIIDDPASGRILLLMAEGEASSVVAEVYDATARLVWRGAPQPLGAGRYALTAVDRAAGIYTVRVLRAGSAVSGKVVLAR